MFNFPIHTYPGLQIVIVAALTARPAANNVGCDAVGLTTAFLPAVEEGYLAARHVRVAAAASQGMEGRRVREPLGHERSQRQHDENRGVGQ